MEGIDFPQLYLNKFNKFNFDIILWKDSIHVYENLRIPETNVAKDHYLHIQMLLL